MAGARVRGACSFRAVRPKLPNLPLNLHAFTKVLWTHLLGSWHSFITQACQEPFPLGGDVGLASAPCPNAGSPCQAPSPGALQSHISSTTAEDGCQEFVPDAKTPSFFYLVPELGTWAIYLLTLHLNTHRTFNTHIFPFKFQRKS